MPVKQVKLLMLHGVFFLGGVEDIIQLTSLIMFKSAFITLRDVTYLLTYL